ncbi:MAG: histidine kinase [Zetaproteobacteria bacterium]|nr:MAG: histidine kinase [Zetaproteobacteria bacterium]
MDRNLLWPLKIFHQIQAYTLFALVIGAFSAPAAFASTNEEIAKDMATLFRSARGVIAKNQKHINDPEVGDKGLSADVVVTKALENYKNATGHDLEIVAGTQSGTFLQAELDAIRSVMDENQDLINEKGKGFKGFLPAIFAAHVASKTSETLAGKAEIKLTAPKEFVRNRKNRPDKWEHNIIETMFKSPDHPKDKTFSENTEKKGKKAFRFILPEYYKEGCLGCHGEPKGELDITGGKKEGGKLGQLGGAISVTIYE